MRLLTDRERSSGSDYWFGDELAGDRISAFRWVVGGWNPDLGEASPRPPVERRNAASQTLLRKVLLVCCEARFALVRPVGCLFEVVGR